MSEPVYTYDEASDTLYISFAPGEAATGIELTNHILLGVNERERRASDAPVACRLPRWLQLDARLARSLQP
ncbi:MAG: DUF2283 domain-containing protein [Candidatus Tectomicrobia bacterium]|jgi:hypothetical protein|nr:DUF2283 domain-containing protein [Candidatus Tectomicrobia bacterium]